MGTMGLALGPCSLPGQSHCQGPLFKVAADAMELGLGVHGEAGVASMPLSNARDAVKAILTHMTNPSSATALHLASAGERLAVIVNNLGGTSKLEELVVAREVVTQLEGMGHKVVRIWAGHMMTSLEMAGILVSVLKVTGRPDWEALLDAPTSAPAWPAVLRAASGPERVTPARVGGMRKEEEELGMMKGAKLEA